MNYTETLTQYNGQSFIIRKQLNNREDRIERIAAYGLEYRKGGNGYKGGVFSTGEITAEINEANEIKYNWYGSGGDDKNLEEFLSKITVLKSEAQRMSKHMDEETKIVKDSTERRTQEVIDYHVSLDKKEN